MLALLLASQVFAADVVVRIPGSYVTLGLPAGFTPATATPGFEDVAHKTLITSQRMPKSGLGAALSIDKLPDMIKGLGQKILTQESPTVDGKKTRLIFSQTKDGFQWLLGVDGPSSIDLVVANFRDAKEKDRVRPLLLTTRVVATEPDIFDGAPMRLTVGAPLRLLGNASGGSYMWTADGKIGALPMLNFVFRTIPSKPTLDESNAQLIFDQFTAARRQVKSMRQVKVGGMPAFEFVGTAMASKTPVAFDSLVLLRGSTFIFVDAQAVAMRSAEELPKLRQMMFTLRPNTK